MIELSHLTKKYGGHEAVSDLTFRMEPGNIYGLLGPNGAGKTTTMNMMTGYLAPTLGTVSVNGNDMMREPQKAKRDIGYLPELPPVYPEMTVEEYLDFAAELKRTARGVRKAQVEEAMERTMVGGVRRKLIRNLSKGYKQRVGLTQALLGNPEILILDEPTVGLDPKQIIEMRDFILSLKETHTVVLSSHILSEVSAVCDHILILSKGRLAASDTPRGLQARMGGQSSLEFCVKGDKETLEHMLLRMEAVERYTVTEQENQLCAAVYTKENEDIREALFYALAEKRMPLLHLERSEQSLEDIFLQLTDSDGVTADGDGAGSGADEIAADGDGAGSGADEIAAAGDGAESGAQESETEQTGEEEAEDDGNL